MAPWAIPGHLSRSSSKLKEVKFILLHRLVHSRLCLYDEWTTLYFSHWKTDWLVPPGLYYSLSKFLGKSNWESGGLVRRGGELYQVVIYLPPGSYHRQSGALTSVRDHLRDTVLGGHAQKESIMGGIIILLTPAPVIDPFTAWKPPLFHKDTAKGKKCRLYGALGSLSCVFMA